jgi:hypothetical protein
MASLATVSTEAANQRVPTEPPSPRTAMQAGGFFFSTNTLDCAMLTAFQRLPVSYKPEPPAQLVRHVSL